MNIFKITQNIYKRLFKDITAIGFIFIFPLIATLMVYAMYMPPPVGKIGITNPDKDVLGLTRFLEDSGKFEVETVSADSAAGLVDEKKKVAVLTINENFMAQIASDKPIYTDVLCKESDKSIVLLNGIIVQYTGLKLSGKDVKISDIDTGEKPLDKPKAAVGIFSMFMLMFAGAVMALLLEDKQKKTFMRIFSSPIKQSEFIAGNLIAFSFIGMIQIAMFLIFATQLIKIDFQMNIFALFLLLFIFFAAAIGLAISIAAVMRDNGKYNLIISLVGIVMSFLSGAFFPIDSLNVFFQRFANLLPQKWLLKAYTEYAGAGGLNGALLPAGILLLFALVFFALGTKVLRPSAEEL